MIGFYEHTNGKDLIIEVLRVEDVTEKKVTLHFRCWNKGATNKPWMITTKVFKAKVAIGDLENWTEYEPEF